MPSVSQSQSRLMRACDHGAGYDSCPPKKVTHEFSQADKGRDLSKLPDRVKKAKGGPVSGAKPFRW